MKNKALYIVAEGQSDATILKELLDCSAFEKVYMIPAGGYKSLVSYVRTIRLMDDGDKLAYRIVVVFDSDSEDSTIAAEKKASMRYLTNASTDERIEFFCFQPDIDICLFGTKDFSKKAIRNNTIRPYIEDHKADLKKNPVVIEIQSFINK